MRIEDFIKKKSIAKRVRLTFILVILIISIGLIIALYERHVISQKYNEYMSVNIEITNLSSEIMRSWELLDTYIKTKDNKTVEEFNASNNIIIEIMKNIEPKVKNNEESAIFLRNLNNMLDNYIKDSEVVINQISSSKTLNKEEYDKIVEIKTLFTYMSKHSEFLSVAYLSQSNSEYLSTAKKNKSTEVEIYIILILIIAFSFMVSMIISRDLNRTIGKLRNYGDLLSDGKWGIPDMEDQKYDELNSLANTFNKMKNNIRESIEQLNKKAEIEKSYHLEKLKGVEKDRLIKETQLLALQSQMDPHFLFNTLNTIGRMALFESAEETLNLIEASSKILRYNLDYKDKLVPLKEEVKMIKAYVVIQATRFQDQMSFDFNIDTSLNNVYIPPMLIQPIVENAIIHGLGEKESGGIISILIKKEDNLLIISIRDNGIGMDGDKIDEICSDNKVEKRGLGVYNVKKRLQLYYNREDLLEIKSKKDEGTEFIIKVPMRGGEYPDKATYR
jgi:two-component system sensor histidine kinase YesM